MRYYLVRIRGTQSVDVFTSMEFYDVETDVLVSSDRGLELGVVKREMHAMNPLGNVETEATERDIELYWENLEEAKEAKALCEKHIQDLDLKMDLLTVVYNFDKSKIFIDYMSDKRVDFRELLKVLSKDLRTRIEFKQIGARDRAKLIGGLGVCGRVACCVHKRSFESITIAMAKNQMIPINNEALTGICGRLKCCLAYENELYLECRKQFPKINSQINYQGKTYRVSDINCIKETLLISNAQENLTIDLETYKKEKSLNP